MNNSTYSNNPQEAIFVPVQKCPYHVTFDLDLEHTLDARWLGVHRVQVWWRSGHLPARSDWSEQIMNIVAWQTYRQTDYHTSLSLAGEVIILYKYKNGFITMGGWWDIIRKKIYGHNNYEYFSLTCDHNRHYFDYKFSTFGPSMHTKIYDQNVSL